MRKIRCFIVLATLFLVACSGSSQEEDLVDLASDSLLSESFESEAGSFSYTLRYDPQKMTRRSDSTVFELGGGGVLRVSSAYLQDLDFVTTEFTDLQRVGDFEVYRYNNEANDCKFEYGGIIHSPEGLLFEMTLCEGDDNEAGDVAFNSLLQGLSLDEPSSVD